MSGIDGEGADDLIGGVLILASLFWPGAEFHAVVGDNTVVVLDHRKAGWPAPKEGLNEIRARGHDPEQWDGLVFRFWRSPFPPWPASRDYRA